MDERGVDGRGAPFRLREWRPADAPALVAAWADPDIARWNAVPDDPSLETAGRWIAGVDQRRTRQLAIDAVITQDAAVVGEVGLSSISPRHQAALVGYWLLPSARGHGLATAALDTFVRWTWKQTSLETVVARCHRDNLASHQVARGAGFTLGAEETDILVFKTVRGPDDHC